MKFLFSCFLLLGSVAVQAQSSSFPWPAKEALLNTAANETYLTAEEKAVFTYINLARTQPQFFADSVLKKYQGVRGMDNAYLTTSPYVTSLYEHLKKMQPLLPLRPDPALYTSARCFAEATGKGGQVGHERKGTGCRFEAAECCSYGLNNALDIALQLLIDNKIESLGHRKICLGAYTYMGISIQPHKEYRHTAVLQFK